MYCTSDAFQQPQLQTICSPTGVSQDSSPVGYDAVLLGEQSLLLFKPSQHPVTTLCPEPHEPIPLPHTLFPEDQS
jgi:hypothetical protein